MDNQLSGMTQAERNYRCGKLCSIDLISGWKAVFR